MAPGQALSAVMQGEMGVVGGLSAACRLAERRPDAGPLARAVMRVRQSGDSHSVEKERLKREKKWPEGRSEGRAESRGEKAWATRSIVSWPSVQLPLPTGDAEAGSTITRGQPHIVFAHDDYMFTCL
jgi:hypothetical protein